MNLVTWAIKWGVSPAALADLQADLGLNGAGTLEKGESEGAAQAAVRLEGAQKGLRLWRNNVGALLDERGVPVRYGLANDSAKMNKVIKSGDLIGIRPVFITQQHLGYTIGQFVSREMKAPGWRYTGTEHEQAQQRWALLVGAMGGDAAFATGTGTL